MTAPTYKKKETQGQMMELETESNSIFTFKSLLHREAQSKGEEHGMFWAG
jgi:hypothetical protein